MASKMYIVVEFEKEIGGDCTIEVLPENWRDTEGHQCFLYPYHYSNERVVRAAKRGEPPTDSWKSFPVKREWYKTESWDGANRRCDRLLDTSNPESDGEDSLPPKRMKRAPRRFMYSQSDCDDASHVSNASSSDASTSSAAVEPSSQSPVIYDVEQATVLPVPPRAPSLQGRTLLERRPTCTPPSKRTLPAVPSTPSSANRQVTRNDAVTARLFNLFERVIEKLDRHEVLLRGIAERQQAEGHHNEADDVDVAVPPLPCADWQSFRELNKLLEDSSLATKNLTRSLSLVGGHSLRALVGNVLKQLLTHRLSKQVNLTGSKGKTSLMGLKALHQVILKSIRRHNDYRVATDQDIHKCIGKWFTNSRDRHGDRAARVQQNQVPAQEPEEGNAAVLPILPASGEDSD